MSSAVLCSRCGAESPPGSAFCQGCGTAFGTPTYAPPAPAYAPAYQMPAPQPVPPQPATNPVPPYQP